MTTTNETQHAMFGLLELPPAKYLPTDIVKLWDETEVMHRDVFHHIDDRFYRNASEIFEVENHHEYTILEDIKTEFLEMMEKHTYEPDSWLWESTLDAYQEAYSEPLVFTDLLRTALRECGEDLTLSQIEKAAEYFDSSDCESRACHPCGAIEIVNFGDGETEDEITLETICETLVGRVKGLADWVQSDDEVFEDVVRWVIANEYPDFDRKAGDVLTYTVYLGELGGLYLDTDTLLEWVNENCPALSGLPDNEVICLADSIHAGNCQEETLNMGRLLGFDLTPLSKPIDLFNASVKFGRLRKLCETDDDCLDMLTEFADNFQATIDSAKERIKNGVTYAYKYQVVEKWRNN